MNYKKPLIQPEQIEQAILLIRGQRVLLDRDLAAYTALKRRVLIERSGETAIVFPLISCSNSLRVRQNQ